MIRGVAAMLLTGTILAACSLIPHRYRISSESMEPTLHKGAVVTGWPVRAEDLRRGMVVVFAIRNERWIFRIAGLPGDEIAMNHGIVSINGKPVEQRSTGANITLKPKYGPETPSLPILRERFPGEGKSHHIIDQGVTPFDNIAPVKVRPGFVFLLGDNRDDAADSRVGDNSFIGTGGPVPIGDVYYRIEAD